MTDSNFSAVVSLLLPHCDTEGKRSSLLTQAFSDVPALTAKINYSGSATEFVPRLVRVLQDHGQFEPGQQALWHLLRTLNVGIEQQQAIDALEAWANAFHPVSLQPGDLITHINVNGANVNIIGLQTTHGNLPAQVESFSLLTPQQRKPFMAATLPPYFVQRPTEFEKLVGSLIDQNGTVAITAAVKGAGGFGKTTLAIALCHDQRIREAFSDGILWVTLGEKPSKVELNKKALDLVYELTGFRPAVKEREAVHAELRSAIGDRRVLLVIDDLWRQPDANLFLTGTAKNTVLITTRLDSQLPEQVHYKLIVDAMALEQAVQLLVWGITEAGVSHLPALKSLAQRLGEWAVLLRLVNAALRKRTQKGESLIMSLIQIENTLSRRGLKAFDSNNPQERTQAISATLKVSLDLLSEVQQQRFARLAIFPEDVDISFTMLEKAWELDEFATEDTALILNDTGLLLNFELKNRTIRLHDVIRQYLIDEHRSELLQWQSDFIRALGNVYILPDQYAWQYIAYHLHEAGQIYKLRNLLLDFPFLQAKFNATDLNAILSDFAGLTNDKTLQLIESALLLSVQTLSQDTTQLALQLHGRLEAFRSNADISIFLSTIQFKQDQFAFLPTSPSPLHPAGGLMRILTGHTRPVRGLRQLTDGRLLSWSDDRTLRLWSSTGIPLSTFLGDDSYVRVAYELADGRLLSWSDENTLRLWASDGTLLATLSGHTDQLEETYKLADGRLLAWSDDDTLHLWASDGTSLATLSRYSAYNGREGPLQLTDGQSLSWGDDSTLRLWASDGTLLATLSGHTSSVNGVQQLTDGRLLSWSDDSTLRLWASDGTLLVTLTGHTSSVNGVQQLADGRLLSWSTDNTLRLWGGDGTLLATLTGHTRSVNGVQQLADGRLLSWSDDSTLRLWSSTPLATLTGHTGSVNGVQQLTDGRLLSWSTDNTLHLWASDGTLLATLSGHTRSVNGVQQLTDGRLLSWSDDSTLRLWASKGTPLATLSGHTGSVNGVQQLADGRLLSWSTDNTLRLWASDGTPLAPLSGHTGSVRGAQQLADGRLLSWSIDSILHLWASKGTPLATLSRYTGSVRGAQELADGRLLSWSDDSTLHLWASDGTLLATLSGHTGSVRGAQQLADGRFLSWSDDSTLRLWASDGTPLATLSGHTGSVRGAQQLANGRLLSWSTDNTLRLWASKGTRLTTLSGHTSSVRGVQQLADGRLLSWSDDNTLRLWAPSSRAQLAAFYADAPITCCTILKNGTIIIGDEQGHLIFLRVIE